MPLNQVHYEVYSRATPNAAWVLQLATEERERAVEAAEEMLASRTAAAVRVTKERLDADTGRFASVSIMTKGVLDGPQRHRRHGEAVAPLCGDAADLYGPCAREAIARVLADWLKRRSATTFELLHRADLAARLEADGTELQHALQKLAVPEAQACGRSTHELMRELQALSEAAIARLVADSRAGRFPVISAPTFAETAMVLSAEADGAYRLGGGVAAYLAASEHWGGKAGALLALIEAAPVDAAARAFALAVVAQPLGEILASPAGVAAILGPGLDLGGTLAGLTQLAAPKAILALLGCEPGLSGVFRPLPPDAERLAAALQDQAFEGLRSELGGRILSELKSPRRLRPTDPEGEIVVLRALAMGLTAAAGRHMSIEAVTLAFIDRSSAVTRSDFVTSLLSGRGGALGEVQALISLAETVAGPLNKKAAARWIETAVTGVRFERELREGEEGAPARLASLASLQKSVRRAGLGSGDEKAILEAIGQVGGRVEADSRLVALIVKSRAPALQRLVQLLKLAASDAAPRGPASERGWAEAVKLLRDPEVRAQLAANAVELARVKELLARSSGEAVSPA